MSDILRVIPKPVPVSLAGTPFLASEFRLDDIATLQAWINVYLPSPFDVAGDVITAGAGTRSRAWHRLMGATIEAQAAWPKESGDPEAEALLVTRGGRELLIALALRRENPQMFGGAVHHLYDHMTYPEFARLSRVAWGDDPLRTMMALVDGDDGGKGAAPDWGQLWVDYGRESPNGPTFAELTISQFLAWRRGGKSYDGRIDGSVCQDWEKFSDRRKAFFKLAEQSDQAEPNPDGTDHAAD